MKKKYFICALILVLVIPFIGFGKVEKITTTSNSYLDPNATCPGVSHCCESGFNVMCQMVDPLKNYAVTDTVCRDRGGGVYHWGVDLVRTSTNGEIYAALEGRVIAVTNSNKQCPIDENLVCSPITCPSSRGNSITIEVTSYPFQGYQMHYMHLSSMDVKVGDMVRQGQKIGIIGTTGCSTGEHLHFQINNLAGDPININGYFEDKGSYICGGGMLSETNKPIYQDYDFTGLFTMNGSNYRATIGNCVGQLNSSFNQGTELIIDDKGTVNINVVESGFYIKNSTPLCVNGVTIRTDKGEYHTYCNIDNLSNMYNVGSYLEKGSSIGSITSYGTKSLLFSINRYGKFVDLSTDFLRTYGGKCSNSDRDNCRKITNNIEYYQCENVIE